MGGISNVVFVTVDCWRYDRCGFNGYHNRTTPVLDSLASNSLIFSNAFATGSYTPESFPGIMAGRLGCQSGYVSQVEWKSIPNGAETIASRLNDAGLNTVATVSNPHLTRDRNYDSGFQSFRNLRIKKDGQKYTNQERESSLLATIAGPAQSRLRSFLKNSSTNFAKRLLIPLFVGYRIYQQYWDWPTVSGEEVVSAFIEDIESTESPLFAWTHLMDLHGPLNADRINKGGFERGAIRQYLNDGHRVQDDFAPVQSRRYDAAVQYVDEQIGRIVEELKDSGKWDETALIVTGDHGEALADRGVYGHPRHYMYDELLRVPLLVRAPGRDHETHRMPFSLGWMGELVSDLLRVEPPDMPLLTGSGALEADGDSDTFIISDSLSSEGHSVSVRDRSNKWITHFEGETEYEYDSGGTYRWQSDRGEQNMLSQDAMASPLADRAEELRTAPGELESAGDNIDSSVQSRLSELGYID